MRQRELIDSQLFYDFLYGFSSPRYEPSLISLNYKDGKGNNTHPIVKTNFHLCVNTKPIRFLLI